MGIITEDFMLHSDAGRRLYQAAEGLPIIDYHCHLNPRMIAEDHRFADPYELFLGGDHYKWRQMRTFGIGEEYITGKADPFEKWMGFARVMPYLIGNPLYHWTALELKRYFDIDEPLNEKSARAIWDACGEKLKGQGFSARQLICRSNVETVCTTDDPADDLHWHRQLKEEGFGVRVLPAFRPDQVINIQKDGFLGYVEKAGARSYEELVEWIKERIAFFHENGGRLADHALDSVPYALGDAREVFEKRMAGGQLDGREVQVYQTALLRVCGAEYARLGWTMQLHIGALRNNNRQMLEALGPDTGFDSINDEEIAGKLSALLSGLDSEGALPKTILYSLNPKDNYVLGTMIGNFQRGPVRGKLQMGAAWWFNDSRDGMEQQLRALANLGTLGTFVGMLTDSRSFVSYPRHEYFRRILCNLLGQWVEDGEYPADFEALETIVRGICHDNAQAYFAF